MRAKFSRRARFLDPEWAWRPGGRCIALRPYAAVEPGYCTGKCSTRSSRICRATNSATGSESGSDITTMSTPSA